MSQASQILLDAKLFDQIWSSDDLSPDRLNHELNKLFTHNQTNKMIQNDTDLSFGFNSFASSSSAGSDNFGIQVPILSSVFGFGSESTSSSQSSESRNKMTHDKFRFEDIQQRLAKQDLHVEWTGSKLNVKSFNVYKLVSVTDHLQVALLAKQLLADQTNGAITRVISALSGPLVLSKNRASAGATGLVGEIRLYTRIDVPPPFPWLLCNGSAVSRDEFARLFEVIGTSYGPGDSSTTFNLPDFRGRIPIGIDTEKFRGDYAAAAGITGGQSHQSLTIQQLPRHVHGAGSLSLTASGGHNHHINDPSHNHGGNTNTAAISRRKRDIREPPFSPSAEEPIQR